MLVARLLFFSAIVFIPLWKSYSMGKVFIQEKAIVETRQSLRRLSTLTISQYPESFPPKVEANKEFWSKIGRTDPMRDYWGTEYRLLARQEKGRVEFFWRSAGPDGMWQTADDVEFQIPFPAHGFLGPSEEDYGSGTPALDAR